MAAAGDIKDLCEEATCPICLEFFTNPVTIVGCGHSFCQACLSRYWGEEEGGAASCPQCRGTDRSFIPNRQLANFVEITKKLRLRGQGGAREAAEGVCEKHQEPLKLFCMDHQAPLCLVCDRSREHESHKVVPREEAFQEYKDIGRTLQRSEKKEAFQNPVAFPPELTCRIGEFYDAKPLLERVMKQFPAVNVTLDPDTAHPQLVLSKDSKSVRWGDKRQDLPDNPERFDCWPSVLGREGFTSGRHFWEVTVGGEGEWWAVGVARKSVWRKGCFPYSPEGGIWAVEMWGGEYRVFASHDPIPLSFRQELRRIRVTLNCAERQVGFSDADTGVHLYTFPGASFRGETLLPFFLVLGEAHLKLSP